MPKTPITFDAILAALAVLSTGVACSKADRAAAEPPAAAPAATAAATPTATSSAVASPPVATAAPAADDEMRRVDAGTERTPAPHAKPKGASAACGATGCSAEMRKGGK